MIKVGITGGIGSGKTTFCKEWEKLGAFVVYADDFAKQMMQEDAELIRKIKDTFGEQSYDEKGNLNRSYLAEEAFQKGRIEDLNMLVHPVLWEKIRMLAKEKEESGTHVFAEEAAILLNNGRPKELDYVILILADQNERIERAFQRDQSSDTNIKERISKQPDFESLMHFADFVVDNNGSLSELKMKAKQIYDKVKMIE